MNDQLIEKGFRIYFLFNEQEKYNQFRNIVFEYFKEKLFIKTKMYPTENTVEGYMELTNKRRRELW